MKTFILLILATISLPLYFSGCAPVYLVPQSEFAMIPKGSKKLIVKTTMSADSLFQAYTQIMLKDGWPIDVDKEIRQIKSEGKSVGHGTFVKPTIFIEQDGTGSLAHISGQWGMDAMGQVQYSAITHLGSAPGLTEIVFERDGTTKPDVAYQTLLVIGKKVPSVAIFFK